MDPITGAIVGAGANQVFGTILGALFGGGDKQIPQFSVDFNRGRQPRQRSLTLSQGFMLPGQSQPRSLIDDPIFRAYLHG